jgi:hypothetical protein
LPDLRADDRTPSWNAVTLARATEQAAAVDDRDVAAFVADEADPLQGARRHRNASPLHAQHHGQELLREQKLIRLHAVMRHQHPRAASLLDGMKLIARGGQRDLVKEGRRIMKHHRSHRSASRQFLFE